MAIGGDFLTIICKLNITNYLNQLETLKLKTVPMF